MIAVVTVTLQFYLQRKLEIRLAIRAKAAVFRSSISVSQDFGHHFRSHGSHFWSLFSMEAINGRFSGTPGVPPSFSTQPCTTELPQVFFFFSHSRNPLICLTSFPFFLSLLYREEPPRSLSSLTQLIDGYHPNIRYCRRRHSLHRRPHQPPALSCSIVEARLSIHIEASHLSLRPAPSSTYRSLESIGNPPAGRLFDDQHLLPQLQGVRRGKGWHSCRKPLARQHDSTLCRSLVQFPSRPTRYSP